MTTDNQPVRRLSRNEEMLRLSGADSRDTDDELLALLVGAVDETVVRELAVLADEVDLGRWLPRPSAPPGLRVARAPSRCSRRSRDGASALRRS